MTIKYFTVENSGFTNGQTFFPREDTRDSRFASMKEAGEYVYECRTEWDDPDVKWRIVEHTYVRVTDKDGREKSSSHFKIYHYVD